MQYKKSSLPYLACLLVLLVGLPILENDLKKQVSIEHEIEVIPKQEPLNAEQKLHAALVQQHQYEPEQKAK